MCFKHLEMISIVQVTVVSLDQQDSVVLMDPLGSQTIPDPKENLALQGLKDTKVRIGNLLKTHF